jgi:predicted metal-dependent hydrolase
MLGGLIQKAFDWLDPMPSTFAVAPARPLDHDTQQRATSEPQRCIILDARSIPYQLTRVKRRSIGLIVGNHGLAVRAPKWTPLYEIEAALRDKSSWILKKLFEAEQRLAHSHKAQMLWQDGSVFDYLGDAYTLQLAALYTAIDPEQKRIWLALPKSASEAQIQDTVQACVQRAALLLFEARLNHFSPMLNVQWRSLKLSNAGGRWGSAKSDGSIRLNWRLMHFRLPVIDYVVVHELSHLRHMDHSPRFWDTVEGIMPDYPQLKNELKAVVLKPV